MKNQTDLEWLAHYVPAMRAVKKPTLPQSIILELAGKADLNAARKRRLATAIKAEKAWIKASQAQNRLGAIVARASTEKRKLETRRKFIVGNLALAEARRNPEFHRLLVSIVKIHITEPRDLAALAPLIEGQSSDIDDQLASAAPARRKPDGLDRVNQSHQGATLNRRADRQ